MRERLTAMGHEVFSPTMTGLGERSHLARTDTDLNTHIDDILAVFHWERLDDVVLCGHSYGGMVVTGVAERIPGKIRSLVYLDGHLPEDGKSMADYMSDDRRRALQEGEIKGTTDPIAPLSAEWFRVNSADRDWVDGFCTPQPRKTFTSPIRVTGATAQISKRTYIRADQYPAPYFDAALARCSADPGFAIRHLDCGHDAMVDDPDGVVELLIEAS